MSSSFVDNLANFLVEKGFKRLGKGSHQGVSSECTSREDEGSDNMKANSEADRKSSFALIGMRSVLRNMRKNVLSAVFFDTGTIKPSSVMTTLGLYATSLQNTKVYAISGLNSALSRTLNMPMVGAVALMNTPATKELSDLAAHTFTSVSISNKQKSTLTVAATELQTPTGKKRRRKK